jgi:Carboxypeptidase regulatory-like domain
MDAAILKTLGETAGLAGLAIGMILLLYREIVRKNVFPTLSKRDAYRLFRAIAVLSWSVAIVGILSWVWSTSIERRNQHASQVTNSTTRQEDAPVVAGTIVDQVTNSAIGEATVAVEGESSTSTSDDTGNFRIVLPAKYSGRVRLLVTKSGYQKVDQSVTPPTHDLILQMRPEK